MSLKMYPPDICISWGVITPPFIRRTAVAMMALQRNWMEITIFILVVERR